MVLIKEPQTLQMRETQQLAYSLICSLGSPEPLVHPLCPSSQSGSLPIRTVIQTISCLINSTPGKPSVLRHVCYKCSTDGLLYQVGVSWSMDGQVVHMMFLEELLKKVLMLFPFLKISLELNCNPKNGRLRR